MATQCALRLVGEEIIKQLQVDAEYTTAFACESDKRKQKFLTECMFKDDRCIFNDICTMGGCTAVCGIHSRPMLGDEQSECPIEVDKNALTMCVCGMSCKDLSSMNMKFPNKANVLSGGGGSTQKTFNGLLEFLGAHHPTVWIGENVDDLSKLQSDNRAFMLNELEKIGYVGETAFLDASKFGAATARKRTWILALHCDKLHIDAGKARSILKKMMLFIGTLRLEAMPLNNFLLKDSEPWAEAVYEHLVQVQSHAPTKGQPQPPKKGEKWARDLKKLLKKKGIAWSKCKPPKTVVDGRWYATLPARDRMVLGYETLVNPNVQCINVAQNPGWATKGYAGILPCILPKGKLYMVKPPHGHEPRPIFGKESLMLHGFPKSFFDDKCLKEFDLSDTFLKDLAGNSFQGFVFAAVLMSLLSNLPVKPHQDEEQLDEEQSHPAENIIFAD